MTFIKTGCCMRCDEPAFEILTYQGEEDFYPGEPKKIGRPLEGSIRVGVLLLDNRRADITLCAACAPVFGPQDYGPLWAKIIRSWDREMSVITKTSERPQWFADAYSNLILAEIGRISWKELVDGAIR